MVIKSFFGAYRGGEMLLASQREYAAAQIQVHHHKCVTHTAHYGGLSP
jgi:hypothetical protein